MDVLTALRVWSREAAPASERERAAAYATLAAFIEACAGDWLRGRPDADGRREDLVHAVLWRLWARGRAPDHPEAPDSEPRARAFVRACTMNKLKNQHRERQRRPGADGRQQPVDADLHAYDAPQADAGLGEEELAWLQRARWRWLVGEPPSGRAPRLSALATQLEGGTELHRRLAEVLSVRAPQLDPEPGDEPAWAAWAASAAGSNEEMARRLGKKVGTVRQRHSEARGDALLHLEDWRATGALTEEEHARVYAWARYAFGGRDHTTQPRES